MMDSLLEQWQPRPVQAVKRFQSITFGGLTLEGTKSWKFYDIEHDATVTASVTPRAVPDRFKTIQKAIDEAVEDEVLWIGPGIYCEKLRICKSVSLVAEEGNVTLLQPDHKESEQSEADKLTPVVWVAPRYGGQVLLSELRIEGLGSSEADLANLSVTPPHNADASRREGQSFWARGRGDGLPAFHDQTRQPGRDHRLRARHRGLQWAILTLRPKGQRLRSDL